VENIGLFPELNSLMAKYKFSPRRKHSQHIMVDEKILSAMAAEAGLSKKDTVLEIGAGTGFLTRLLAEKSKVLAVEQDIEFCRLLEEEFRSKNLTVLCGDIRKVKLPPYNKVVSNPPYHISSDIIWLLVEKGFDLALLTFEREFVFKLLAEEGYREYNAISVITNYCSRPEIIFDKISSSSFFPRPNAISALVKLTAKKRFGEAKNEKFFRKFVKSVFRYRNKNISNAMEKAYKELSGEFRQLKQEEYLKAAEKFFDVKVCQLSVKEFVEISNLAL